MEFLVGLFTNKIFIATVAAWLIAQLLKIVIDLIKGVFSKERLYGGMPSSHSATVASLATITGLTYGSSSFEFVMALIFGILVIFDSRGVRFETQRQGKALNNLNEERLEEGKQPLDIIKFKEKLGHSIAEIVVGMLVGIACAIIIYRI